MTKFIVLAAVSAAALAATPAIAAPAGPRVEAIIGGDQVRLDLDDVGINDSFKDEGVLYGVGVGYDFALSNGVSLGVDLEATDSSTKESNVAGTISAKRDLYAGGRVSFPIDAKNSNVYLKAGYTNARFRASDGAISESGNADGYRLGAGAQFSLNGKAYIGGEYRYSNYEGDFSRHQLAATLGTRF
jgi:outer membrane immunogenic protein